jgi:hypothetical protein
MYAHLKSDLLSNIWKIHYVVGIWNFLYLLLCQFFCNLLNFFSFYVLGRRNGSKFYL